MDDVKIWNLTWNELCHSPEYKKFRALELGYRKMMLIGMPSEVWKRLKTELRDAKRDFRELARWHPYADNFARRNPAIS